MRYLYEIELSERELQEIIKALRLLNTGERNPIIEEQESFRRKLARRIESELWRPYHESVAQGKRR